MSILDSYTLMRPAWTPPLNLIGYMPRTKSNAENELQGRYLSPQADASLFSEAYRQRLQLAALARLEVQEAVAEVASRTPAEVKPYPSLIDSWMRSELDCLGRTQPELAEAVGEELRARRSPMWPSPEDVRACESWLGEYRAPPPPEPERPAPSAEYLAAATLIIEACSKQGIGLAIVDPNNPRSLTKCLDARAAGNMPASDIVRRIEAGYLLAWTPTGRRLIPPSIEVAGHAWRELEGGTGVVLAPVEGEPKAPARKAGAK